MENVKGLMSCNAGISPDASVLGMILDDFHALGYKTIYGVLDSVNYGVPQFRERFIMIGSRDHEKIYLPLPTHFHIHQNPDYRWNILQNAIGGMEESPGEYVNFSSKRMDLLRLVPEGGNWRSLPDDIVQVAMGGAYKSIGGKVGFYRRLSYSQPCPTLVASPVQKASMLCHPKKDRPLSIREYAKIQQFPDDWRFSGSPASKYRQIGNAVPVGLAKAIGQTLVSVADCSSTINTKRIRGTGVHSKILAAVEMGVIHGNKP
jgi:DNA (cytosine-5)-methyltransferase 1